VTVESRTTDRVAAGMVALYGAGLLLWFVLAIGYALRGRWLPSAIGLALVLLFSLQAWGWWNGARARVRIDEKSISRNGAGPCRWTVPHQEVSTSQIQQIRGVPYLVVTASVRPRTGRLSRLLLGGNLPKDAVAAPLAPEAVPEITRALARSDGNRGCPPSG
jgi:hypothetical protein